MRPSTSTVRVVRAVLPQAACPRQAPWSGETMQDYVDARGILVNPLVDEGYPSIGCAPCTAKPAPGADPRSGRWAASG